MLHAHVSHKSGPERINNNRYIHTQTHAHMHTQASKPHKHKHTTLIFTDSLQWSKERWLLMWNINFQVSCSAWPRQVSAMTHLGQISSCEKLICHLATHLSVLKNRTHTHTQVKTYSHPRERIWKWWLYFLYFTCNLSCCLLFCLIFCGALWSTAVALRC